MARPAPKKIVATPERPVLQWIAAGLGGLVTVAVVAVIAWEAFQPDAPPLLHARVIDVAATLAGFVAEVEVANDGLNTAAAVDISGTLGSQTSTATIDYVPGHGRATAYLRFDADPRAAVVRVSGWSEP